MTAGPFFKSIKEVPDDRLRETFQTIIRRGGAVDRDGLFQLAARELGFNRTGKKIPERLEASVYEKLQVGHLRWVGERVGLGAEDSK